MFWQPQKNAQLAKLQCRREFCFNLHRADDLDVLSFVYLQIKVRICHSWSVCQGRLQRLLGLLIASLAAQDAAQISQSCKEC